MLIIGCGNLDRADDAAGILVAQRLREQGLEAVEHSGDGLALVDMWNSADDVIVIDAMVSGASVGAISAWNPVTRQICEGRLRCSTHDFGPAEAVELARVLDRLPQRIQFYGIEAANFEPGAEPSAEVLAAVDQVVKEIAVAATSAIL